MGAVTEGCACGNDAINDDIGHKICPNCRIVPPTDDYEFCYKCGTRLCNRREVATTRKEGEEGWKVGGTALPDDLDDRPVKRFPEENTDAFDQLQVFLEEQELVGIAKKMKDKVGIIKLDDLMHASEADVDNICDTLKLKMGEKLRLKGAIKQYRDEWELGMAVSPAPMYSVETVQLMDQLFETLEMANVEPSSRENIHSAVKSVRESFEKRDPGLEGMSDNEETMGEDSHSASNDPNPILP